VPIESIGYIAKLPDIRAGSGEVVMKDGTRRAIPPFNGGWTQGDSEAQLGDPALVVAVRLPTGVSSIEDLALRELAELGSVVIPPGVTSIGDSALEFCQTLNVAVLPDNCRMVGDFAFHGCSHYTVVRSRGSLSGATVVLSAPGRSPGVGR
jgi:hypothetical protein